MALVMLEFEDPLLRVEEIVAGDEADNELTEGNGDDGEFCSWLAVDIWERVTGGGWLSGSCIMLNSFSCGIRYYYSDSELSPFGKKKIQKQALEAQALLLVSG
jgi:hypothetical protein